MGAVLFKRFGFSPVESHSTGIWNSVSADLKTSIKAHLLCAVRDETKLIVRQKVCEVISEIARTCNNIQSEWSELLPFMFESFNSEHVVNKESSLLLFTGLVGFMANSLLPYLSVIEQMIFAALLDVQNLSVRIQGVKASGSLLAALDDAKSLSRLANQIPLILQVSQQCVAAREEDSARTVFEVLVDLAENRPKLFKKYFENLSASLIPIVENVDFDDSTRQLALEILVTLCEKIPAFIRKTPGFCAAVLPALIRMMIDIEDDPDWSTSQQLEDEDHFTNSAVGEQSMDRLAICLGGRFLLPNLFQVLTSMLKEADWRYRHAALMAVSAVGEGCAAQMESELANILAMVLPFLHDPHPRVRYAACNALGQMASDFYPNYQNAFHAQIIPA
eukprot:Sdes_comp20310_c0_seq4m13948